MWYIVLSRATGREESRQLHYEEHRKWLEDQHEAGRLLFSGPTSDRAYGIYIMLASSKSEAERTAAQDPHHVHGDRTMEVLEWDLRRAFRKNGPTIADLERMATGR
jgi:uncharacterized protein YciI